MSSNVSTRRSRPLFDPPIVRRAVIESFKKLDPRLMVKNPVMFVTMVGAALTTVGIGYCAAAERGFVTQLAIWLWFTVLFANFAEAVAEGRGKAQANALRNARAEMDAVLFRAAMSPGIREQHDSYPLIANPQGKLRVNMSANAEIVLEDHKNTLLVPEAALVREKDGKTSVQKRDATAKSGFTKVPIKTGISNGQRTEVLDGRLRVNIEAVSVELREPDPVMFQPPVGHELVSPLMQEQRYKARFPGHELFGQAVYKLEQQYQSGLAASKQRQSK